MAKKILLIEDDLDLTEALKLRLGAEQYEITTAANGREGLEKFEAEKPDLVLLDVGMPEMDGYSFVRVLKSRYSLNEVPILVLSAKTGMEDMFALEGVRGFLSKPCDPDELLEKIKSCLR